MVNDPSITTVTNAYKQALNELTQAGVESAKLETLVLLCFVLNCDKTYLHTHGDDIFPQDKLNLFKELIAKRASHVPLQHLTGYQEFMSMNFLVNSNVLIPRQDTEILVEAVLEEFKNNLNPLKILDIGTGSGCIAISLAKYLPNSHVTAIDISPQALETAKKNADLNNTSDRVNFIQSDLFNNILNQKFDIIVSNPPYIPSLDVDDLMSEVRLYEPLNALDGGTYGLDFYKKIVSQAPSRLTSGGFLAFEAGIHQALEIKKIMEKDFVNLNIKKDLSRVDRVIFGYLK